MTDEERRAPRSTAWLKTPTQLRGTLDGLSWDGVALWYTTQLFCASVNNRGMLPKAKLPVAVARRLTGKKLADAVAELVAEKLWEDHGDAYELIDFAIDNPDAETWTDPVLRERLARRNALKRDTDLCKRIKQRDRNLCRYCGIRVIWSGDRRSKASATYDHVDPDGDNRFSNVVVACRRCNGIKKDRTPEQAGMPLLPAGTTEDVAASLRAASAAGSSSADLGDLSGVSPGSRSEPAPNQLEGSARARDGIEPDPNQIGPDRTRSQHTVTDLVSTGLVGSANPGPTEDPSSSDEGGRARADD